MQIRAENQNLVSALSITINKILCQFFEFTQNLKRSQNRKSVIFKNLKNGYGAGTTELHILRPYESTILPEYVLAYVKSSMFISKGKQEFTGAVGQQRIGKDYLENSYFPIPPLEEQVRIVEQISTVYKQLNMISDASLV